MSKPAQGKGNFQAFMSLVVFILMMMVFWNVGSVYAVNWALKDKMVEAARSQRNAAGDRDTYEKLGKVIAELGLEEWLSADMCEVALEGMNRRVKCAYERDMTIIFSIKRRVSFENEVFTPLL